jgi:hypothetical protein
LSLARRLIGAPKQAGLFDDGLLDVTVEVRLRQGWAVVTEYTDAAISGATLMRAGIQSLMRDAAAAKLDLVLAEALDRFSRDQEDIAHLTSGFPIDAGWRRGWRSWDSGAAR